MNPHRMAWGLASEYELAKWTALATLLGFLFSKDKKTVPFDLLLALMLLLWAHFTLTSFTAFNPDVSWVGWQKTSKIFLMTFLTIPLFRQKNRLNFLIWVVIISVAFYGVKGGIFTLITGGQYMVWGPDKSFFGGNTGLALVLNMILPFLFFHSFNQSNKYMRYGLLGSFFLTLIAIIGTNSRGGLVGLVAVLLAISGSVLLRTRKKLVGFVFIGLCILAGTMFAPQKWFERMHTIQTYEQDASAMGRINAWWFAFNLANDRPLIGGGFDTYNPELFLRYAPNPKDFHDAHSIYFRVLADHGYPGLFLYLTIIILVFRTLRQLGKIAKTIPSLNWTQNYVLMFKSSIIAFLSNGVTLGLAYFDLFWLVVAMTVCLKLIVQDHIEALKIQLQLDEKQSSIPSRANNLTFNRL